MSAFDTTPLRPDAPAMPHPTPRLVRDRRPAGCLADEDAHGVLFR